MNDTLANACPALDSRPALHRLLGDAAPMLMPAGVCPYPLLQVEEGSTLLHEGAPARTLYVVQAGDFKTTRNGEDGYEQVLDFVGTDAVLGCDGLADGHYASGAVALADGWVHCLPATDIQHLCQLSPGFALRWQSAMARQIARAGDHAWVMCAVGAEKRVARFLTTMAAQQVARGGAPRRLHLPMCRRDLASHLGLSHESISRALTLLQDVALLKVCNRDVELLDTDELRAFASSTRGYAALRRGLQAGAASQPGATPAGSSGWPELPGAICCSMP